MAGKPQWGIFTIPPHDASCSKLRAGTEIQDRPPDQEERGLEKVPEDWMEGSTLFFPQFIGLLLLRVPVRSIVHTNCSLSPFRFDFLNPDKSGLTGSLDASPSLQRQMSYALLFKDSSP